MDIKLRKTFSREPTKGEKLAELVLIYFLKEELHPDEADETMKELIKLAQEIEKGA